jgi:hypothetical protein
MFWNDLEWVEWVEHMEWVERHMQARQLGIPMLRISLSALHRALFAACIPAGLI